MSAKFVQITAAVGGEDSGVELFALDEDGAVWTHYWAAERPADEPREHTWKPLTDKREATP